jgi:uncharacterized protein YxeA
MKTILILIALTVSILSAKTPMWDNYNETVWSDSGKIYIKIHVVSKDLDQGMHSTEARFKEIVTNHFCDKEGNSICIYYNLKRENTYWEMLTMDENTVYFDIYRTFSIEDVYSNR